MALKKTIIEPAGQAEACVIWLHGLGASSEDFTDVVPYLGLPNHRIRFVFPDAPSIPITLNGGLRMPGWYDIRSLNLMDNQDEAGIRHAEGLLKTLVEEQVRQGIPSEKIIVMGFSQGGAVSLQFALRYPQKLAGVGVLSSYLLLPEKIATEKHLANQETSFFIAHGSLDPMVPLALAQLVASTLETLKYKARFHSYPMAHMVCSQELSDLGRWISEVL